MKDPQPPPQPPQQLLLQADHPLPIIVRKHEGCRMILLHWVLLVRMRPLPVDPPHLHGVIVPLTVVVIGVERMHPLPLLHL
jgi:hypothetical protein